MKALVILFSIFWVPGLLLAQTSVADSAMIARAMQHQRVEYHRAVNANSSLYNGTEYKEQLYNSKNDAIAYFLTDDWIEGSIIYDNQLYEKADLQYNIVSNKIITHPFYSWIKIELIPERIEQFTMSGHTFVRLKKISGTDNFYDRLVDGPAKLYALRKKEVLEELGSGKIVHVFVDKTKYYVLHNGEFTPVRTKRDLFKLFPEYKNQIKKALADKGIKIRKINPENGLIEGVSVYNKQQLN